MKKVKLQPRERLIIAIALSAVLGYGFYSFWFSPNNNKISNIKSQIAEQRAEVKNYTALIAKSKEYTDRKPETESKATNLSTQLPSVNAAPSVLEDLKSLIERNGATIKSISYDKAGAKKGGDPNLDSRTVNISLIANYPQASAIVKEVETGSRTCTFSNFSLNKDKTGAINGTMTVETYFAKTPLPGFEYKPLLETQGKADPFAQ